MAGPLRSPSTVANSVAVTRAEIGGDLAIALAAKAAAQENDAGIGFGRMQRQGDGRTGVDANTGDSRVTTQRRLTAG